MRKNNICTILFCLMICVFLGYVLIFSEVFGIELEQNYNDNFGPFVGELYFDDMVNHSSIFCNGHGTPFFVKKKTRIDITGWVKFGGTQKTVSKTIEGFSDELDKYNAPPDGTTIPDNDPRKVLIAGPVSHGECGSATYNLKLTATSYSGSGTTTIAAACSPKTATVSSTDVEKKFPLVVYATGITNYKVSLPAKKEINNNIAYLLAEANSNTVGLKPVESEANIAWWNKDSSSVTMSGDANEFEYFSPEEDPRADDIEAAAEEAIETLSQQVIEIENLIQQLNQELTILNTDNQTAQAKTAELEAKISELEAYIANEKYGRSLFEGYRDYDEQKLVQLKIELETLQTNLKDKQKEFSKVSKEQQALEGQISRLNSDIDRLQDTVNTLNTEIATLTGEIDVLNQELAELRNNGATTNEISAKNLEINNKQAELDKKQTELNAKTTVIANKQTLIDQKFASLNIKQSEVVTKQDEFYQAQILVIDKQKEIDRTDATLKNDKKIIEQCEKNIAEAEKNIEVVKSELESYRYVIGVNNGSWQQGTTPNKATMTYEEYRNYLEQRIQALEAQKTQIEQDKSAIENSKGSDKTRVDIIKDIYNKYQEKKSTDKEGFSAHSAAGKLHEADIFNRMHNVIRKLGGDIGPGATVDYQTTVEDLTDISNVKVDYNAETQEYTVGPFSIQYLEAYAYNNQFAGITGDPVLSVMKDGEEIKMKLSEGGWGFAYKERNNEGRLVDVERKKIGTLGDQVPQMDGTTVFTNFDAVPHTNEEFYIVVEYGEGIHKITGLEFEFRCLTIEAEREEYTGTVEKYKWELNAISFGKCTEEISVSTDSNTDNETDTSTDTNTGTDNGTDTSTDTDTDTSIDTGTTTVECGNDNAAYVIVQRSKVGDIDIQPTMRVIMAQRGYAELTMYNKDNLVIVPDSSPASLKIEWEIDLTTTVAGDVWVDEDSKKVNNAIDGIRQPEIDKESGIKNIAVTVYLYSGTSKVKEAIAHDNDTGRIEWPIYTDGAGHWEIDRLEAPGGGSKYFYVVEFEYDGQYLMSTTYMADSNGTQGTATQFKENPDNYKNSSIAFEEVDSRYKFDQTFGEITGDSQISDGETKGFTNTTDESGENAAFNPDDVEPGSPAATWDGEFTDMQLSNELVYRSESITEEGTGKTRVKSTLKSPYTDDENPAKVTWGDESATKEEYKRYRMVATTFYSDSSKHDVSVNKDDFRPKLPTDEWEYTMNKNVDGNKRYIGEYMLHINLGLKERKETDISVLKDLYKVTVVVNERKITKEFNPYGDKTNYSDLLVGLENFKNDGGYKLGLYASDVAYQSYQRYCNAISKVQEIKEGTELRVFATYIIRAYNNSDTNDIEINELIDYYDPDFTLVEEDFSTAIVNDDMKRENIRVAEAPYYRICDANTVSEWKPTREDNLANYNTENSGNLVWEKDETADNKLKTTDLTKNKIKRSGYAEIFTTYEVDQTGYENMRDNHSATIAEREWLLKEHYNLAEISNYSTYYSEEDLEPERSYHPYKAGWVSGKVDKDSAPNNINRDDITSEGGYEDDTHQAPMLNIELKSTERDMWGVVWEDKKQEELDYGIKAGDGIFNGENTIDGIEVSLFEVINLSEVNSGGDYSGDYDGYEYYYKVPSQFYNFPQGSQNGNDGTGAVITGGSIVGQGNWYIYGFLAGDYTIRFDYGKNTDANCTIYKNDGSSSTEEIIRCNGQDYENTRFMGNYLEDSTINDKFLDLTGKAVPSDSQVSKARDNESRRMVVNSFSRTIENDTAEVLRDRLYSNDEYVESTQMFSETPIMQVEVEDPKIIQRNDTPGGTPANPLFVEGRDNVSNAAYRYTIPNINFGVEERPKTDIRLEKYIDTICLLKSGVVICQASVKEDGTIDTQSENSQYLEKITTIGHTPYDGSAASGTCQQGFFAIAVENEYMSDLSLMITYKLKVLNDSEVDFTGALYNYFTPESIVGAATSTDTVDLYNVENGLLSDLYEDGISSNNTLHNLLEMQDGGTSPADSRISELIANGDTYSIDPDDSLRPEAIVYGKYVGRFYYENRIGEEEAVYQVANHQLKTTDVPTVASVSITYPADNVVKTTVDQLIEYIDINTNLDFDENSSIENASWTLVDTESEADGTIVALKNVISDSAYKDHGRNEGEDRGIYDEKGRKFFRNSNVNIAVTDNEFLTRDSNNRVVYSVGNASTGVQSAYNPDLTNQLVPKGYSADEDDCVAVVYFTTRKNTASDIDANEMKMDNLAEVLIYSNTVGRRDVNSVPGNALAIAKNKGFWLAGYNSIDHYGMRNVDDYTNVGGAGAIYDWTSYPENDQFAPEYVSIIPPTGTAYMTIVRKNVIQLVGMSIVLIGLVIIFIIKQKRQK